MERLMAAGKASKTGQKRGTVYSWGRGSSATGGKGRRKKKATRKKASRRKKTTRRRS